MKSRELKAGKIISYNDDYPLSKGERYKVLAVYGGGEFLIENVDDGSRSRHGCGWVSEFNLAEV